MRCDRRCWCTLHLVLRLRGSLQIFVKTLTGNIITLDVELLDVWPRFGCLGCVRRRIVTGGYDWPPGLKKNKNAHSNTYEYHAVTTAFHFPCGLFLSFHAVTTASVSAVTTALNASFFANLFQQR